MDVPTSYIAIEFPCSFNSSSAIFGLELRSPTGDMFAHHIARVLAATQTDPHYRGQTSQAPCVTTDAAVCGIGRCAPPRLFQAHQIIIRHSNRSFVHQSFCSLLDHINRNQARSSTSVSGSLSGKIVSLGWTIVNCTCSGVTSISSPF